MIADCTNFDIETLIRLLIKQDESGGLYLANDSGGFALSDAASCSLSLTLEDMFRLSLNGTIPDITINTQTI
jgi:hypothetical protein